VLVAPRWDDVLQRQEAIDRASGATDVLEKARMVATLDEAIEGVDTLCATAMVPRDFGPPTSTPREFLPGLPSRSQGVGFLFGSERYGMRNEDVYRCHVALTIPTSAEYGSLNLAAAVQLVAYEWRLALGGFDVQPSARSHEAADAQAVAGMLAHLETSLVAIGFLDPAAPKKLMPRLNQLFNRAQPTPEEIHILRGVAKAMAEAAGKRKP
jgi:tRNA/rRNA methyltransferase